MSRLVPRALLVPLLAVFVLASPAGALPFSGELLVEIGSLRFAIPGAGEGVSTPSSFVIESGGLTTTRVIPLTAFPSLVPIVDVQLGSPAGLDAASFALGRGHGGGFGGDAALRGTARLGLFGPPPIATLPIPLSVVGVEGSSLSVSAPFGIGVVVEGGGWTTGRAVFDSGFGSTQARTGTDLRTPLGAGRLVLVSASVVNTGISADDVALFATLDLRIEAAPAPGVPEPGALGLFALGFAAVGLSQRRRKRS